jgi:hypothetical protein
VRTSPNEFKVYAKVAQKAAAEAKATAETLRPGQVNLTVRGNFDGEVAVLVDGAEVARSTGNTIAVDNVRVGARKVMARGSVGGKRIEASLMIDVKPGVQQVELSF